MKKQFYLVVRLLVVLCLVGGCKKTPPPPPANMDACVDFADIPLHTNYPYGHVLQLDGVKIDIFYTTGGRINERPEYPPSGSTHVQFLELAGQGSAHIYLPTDPSVITLDVLQGGPDAVKISCGGFTNSTSRSGVIERINFTGSQLDTVKITGSETYIYRVCWKKTP